MTDTACSLTSDGSQLYVCCGFDLIPMVGSYGPQRARPEICAELARHFYDWDPDHCALCGAKREKP